MTLFNNIIVPLDGSELSSNALPAASVMAKASGAPITLLRSYDSIPEWKVDSQQGRRRGSMAVAEHDRVAAWLRAKKERMENGELASAIRVEAHEGPATESIINLANQDPGALIAMSTHGRGGISRMLMGSVTAKVVSAVANPTLIVRCNDSDCPVVPRHFENIIVPLDGSVFAERAIPLAQGVASALGARLMLVRTTPDSNYFRLNSEWGAHGGISTTEYRVPENLAVRLSETAKTYLWRKADRLSAVAPDLDVEAVHSLGPPSEKVIRMTGQLDNTLVVMATRGRRGIGRAFLGSIADRIVRHSQAPTLLVRGPFSPTLNAAAQQGNRDREVELTAV